MTEHAHDLSERVATVESQLEELTTAVNELTTTLKSGKLALKMFLGLVSVGVALASGFAWLYTHITFNGS